MKKKPQTQPKPQPKLPTAEPTRQDSTAIYLAIILIAGLVAYANTFSVPFVLDDRSSISENPVIKNLQSFLGGSGYAYNPRRFVGYLTFALNYHFGGLNVLGYHLVNLCIHVANGFLVYALTGLALKTVNGERETVNGNTACADHRSPLTAYLPLFAALLFVVHPVQTQAVTYIVQRLASLATLFYLGAVVCYAKGRHEALGSGLWGKESKAGEHTNRLPFAAYRSPFTWFFLAVISGLLALKTKEIAVTLPLAIILYEFIFYGFSRKKLFILLIPLVLGAIVAAIGIAGSGRPLGELLSDVTEMSRETTAISRMDYLITQFAVIATYLRLLVLPINQNLDYDYPIYSSLAQARPLLGLLLHLALIGVAIYAWRKAGEGQRAKGEGDSKADHSPFTIHYSLIAFGIFWFYLTLSVESSLIPITDVIYEHRLYLPSVGFFLAVGAVLDVAARKMGREKVVAAAAMVVLTFMAATLLRNRVWGDQLFIWSDAVSKSPAKARPHSNLGKALHDAGDDSNAIAHLQMALRLDSGDPFTHFNIGVYLDGMNQFQLARDAYRRAMMLKPNFAQAMGNLANDLIVLGQTDEAVAVLQEALRIEPANTVFLNSLGVAFLARGDTDRAAAALEEAIRIMPAYDKAHLNLGRVHQTRGDYDLAAREFAIANSIAGSSSGQGRITP
jgi:Flp pilus assembly protein TadD